MWKNLVTLVTGSASGLGKATAQRIAKKGANVVMYDLPSSNGAAIATEIGSNALFVPGDVTSDDEVRKLMIATKEKFGRLDVIIHCAAAAQAYQTYNFKKAVPSILDDFKRTLTTNLVGTFNVATHGVGLIAENQPDDEGIRGIIINVATSRGFKRAFCQVANASASDGVRAITKSLGAEYRPHGIRVVGIGVGLFETPLISHIPLEVLEPLADSCHLYPNRLGSPEEFAVLVERIVQISHLNGVTVDIDAGLRMIM